MLAKADIVIALNEAIEARRMDSAQAAARVGIGRAELARLLRGDTIPYDVPRLSAMLAALG